MIGIWFRHPEDPRHSQDWIRNGAGQVLGWTDIDAARDYIALTAGSPLIFEPRDLEDGADVAPVEVSEPDAPPDDDGGKKPKKGKG